MNPLNHPDVNPFDATPELVRCDGCLKDLTLRDFFVPHMDKNYHPKCIWRRTPGHCFYCNCVIDIQTRYYTWYTACVCVACVENIPQQIPETPKMQNAHLPTPPPILSLDSLSPLCDPLKPDEYKDLIEFLELPEFNLDDVLLHPRAPILELPELPLPPLLPSRRKRNIETTHVVEKKQKK